MNVQVESRYYVNNLPIQIDCNINVTEEYYQELRRVLRISRVIDGEFVRLGNDNDGGYIMLDHFYENGIAYSFGISNDVSWDLDMARLDYDIFMYDPTIEALPQSNNHFHFFRKGIAGRFQPEQSMDTLEHFLAQNHHNKDSQMILKMDVEGAEWDFLSTVSSETLSKFDQILFEFHSICRAASLEMMGQRIQMLKKINETHTLVHLHGNNTGICLKMDHRYIPDVIEATYVKSDICRFTEDEDICLPLSLDAPNSSLHSEVPLGYWNR